MLLEEGLHAEEQGARHPSLAGAPPLRVVKDGPLDALLLGGERVEKADGARLRDTRAGAELGIGSADSAAEGAPDMADLSTAPLQIATIAKPAEEEKPKEEKPKPPRMICEGCGRSYSIHARRRVCKAPEGFEEKENIPPEPLPPAPPVDPVQQQITLVDVTQFLIAEPKARR